nr:hypothetical protein [Tanacetum cinerariifolium]
HVRETTTTTQNPAVDNLAEKPVRLIYGPAGIVQVAKIRKQSDIHEDGDESVLSTQEYIRKVVDDVGEDANFKGGSWVNAVKFVNANGGGIVNGCLGDIKNYLKNGKFEQVISIIKFYTPNAHVFSSKPSILYVYIIMRNVVKVFHKDTLHCNGNGVGGSEMLDEEEIMKLLEEEEMADLELQAIGMLLIKRINTNKINKH